MRPKYLIYLANKFPVGLLINSNGYFSVYAKLDTSGDEVKAILKSLTVSKFRLGKLTKHNTNKFHYHYTMPMKDVSAFVENLENTDMYQIKRIKTFGRMYR